MDFVNRVCRPMQDQYVIVFIDDIFVCCKTKEQHEEHLCDILVVLWMKILYAKLSKCEFWLHEVQFLGHLVNQNSILVDPANIEAVIQWEVPRSPSEICSFLGLVGYYEIYSIFIQRLKFL